MTKKTSHHYYNVYTISLILYGKNWCPHLNCYIVLKTKATKLCPKAGCNEIDFSFSPQFKLWCQNEETTSKKLLFKIILLLLLSCFSPNQLFTSLNKLPNTLYISKLWLRSFTIILCIHLWIGNDWTLWINDISSVNCWMGRLYLT